MPRGVEPKPHSSPLHPVCVHLCTCVCTERRTIMCPRLFGPARFAHADPMNISNVCPHAHPLPARSVFNLRPTPPFQPPSSPTGAPTAATPGSDGGGVCPVFVNRKKNSRLVNNFVRLTRLIRRNGGGFTVPDVVRYIIITSAVLCTRGTRARFAGVRQWRGREIFSILLLPEENASFSFFFRFTSPTIRFRSLRSPADKRSRFAS